MDNFMYLVGDIQTRQCAIVDGCWDPKGIVNYAEHDGMKLVRKPSLGTRLESQTDGTLKGLSL
eukprot:scaffold4437_cov391-Prasinococcus_capsulatus_cf.AAC.5